jgi:tRNA threonylcarbamoyladenosine biosynthesis protein TsaE
MTTFVAKCPEDLSEIAIHLIAQIKNERVIAFHGEMGAGKTTLIKSICKALGTNDSVTSPTYSLVNEYHTESGDSIYHFDFYRIESPDEAVDMGFDEYIYSNSFNLIEWPEKIIDLLPSHYVKVSLNLVEDDRIINVEFVS